MTLTELKTKLLAQDKPIALVSFKKSVLERYDFKIEGFYDDEDAAGEASDLFEEDAGNGIDIYDKSDLL